MPDSLPPALLALVLGGAACSGADPTARAVHPLDTAILFPLPDTSGSDHLLRVDSAGSSGVLLPSYASDQLPALSSTSNTNLLPELRVIAANIDPCFPSGVEGRVDSNQVSLCRKQIRLIFQPVHPDAGGALTTDDVTVHAFYEMSETTFHDLVTDLRAARDTDYETGAAVDVNPIMAADGAGGSYQRAVQDTLLQYAGAANLVKVTFIGLRGGGIGWQMGGIDFVGTAATDMTIPATQVTRQEVINNAAVSGDFDATVDPETQFTMGLGLFLDSSAARVGADAEVRAAFRQALELDNPSTDLNPGTVDCASCHLATPTRHWAERDRGLVAAEFAESYTNATWNLENRSETQADTQVIRCFGYYGRRVAISQRTINEAAAVADHINAKTLGGVQ